MPVAHLVRRLARNTMVRKLTKNELIRNNRYFQALRYSVVRHPIERSGAQVPIALKVRVNSKLDIEPGSPAFFGALRGVVWADPLRIAKWDHIAVWRVNHDPAATSLANVLGERVFPSANRDLVCLIDELNPELTSTYDLLTLLGRTRTAPTTEQFTEQRNLLVVVDPPTRTATSISTTWSRTRTVVLLTRPSPFQPSTFADVDALLVADAVDPKPYEGLGIPFLTRFSEFDDALAQVKALVSGSVERPPGYHFAVKGRIEDLPAAVDHETDIVCVVEDGAVDASAMTTFADYLAALIDRSELVAVHSRFLYSHESLIRDDRPELLLQRLISRGARMRVLSGQFTAQPVWSGR